MAHATSKRRGHGADPTYWDASRNRYIGAASPGLSPGRQRAQVEHRPRRAVPGSRNGFERCCTAFLLVAVLWAIGVSGGNAEGARAGERAVGVPARPGAALCLRISLTIAAEPGAVERGDPNPASG